VEPTQPGASAVAQGLAPLDQARTRNFGRVHGKGITVQARIPVVSLTVTLCLNLAITAGYAALLAGHYPIISFNGRGAVTIPIVTCQQFLLSLLDDLVLPYGIPNARAYVTPPDPRIQARVPAIYIWPADGDENRTEQLGGTIPRNTGPGTASGTKGIMHRFDVYLTWVTTGSGTEQDPKFPGMVDALMYALRFSQPNPYFATDPNSGLQSTIYNTGEVITYRTGVESTSDERMKRYDCLCQIDVWEVFHA